MFVTTEFDCTLSEESFKKWASNESAEMYFKC